MASVPYSDSVFLNVPFDAEYQPIFDALVFTVFDCGFVTRAALETDDSTQVRIQKIYDLIDGSKYGIHDISRTGLTVGSDFHDSTCRWSSAFSWGPRPTAWAVIEGRGDSFSTESRMRLLIAPTARLADTAKTAHPAAASCRRTRL
jgi:hypothetical protein